MTASFLALVQFVTFDEEFALSPSILSKTFVITGPEASLEGGGGGGGPDIYELCRYVPLWRVWFSNSLL